MSPCCKFPKTRGAGGSSANSTQNKPKEELFCDWGYDQREEKEANEVDNPHQKRTVLTGVFFVVRSRETMKSEGIVEEVAALETRQWVHCVTANHVPRTDRHEKDRAHVACWVSVAFQNEMFQDGGNKLVCLQRRK